MESLDERARRAEARVEELDDLVAAAVLDGRAGEVASLRSERAALIEDLDDLASAAALAEERSRQAEDARRAARRRDALDEAGTLEARRRKAAGRVDAALADLEAAHAEHEAVSLELERSLAGHIGGRLLDVRARRAMLRSACWLKAPAVSSALGIGFTPGNKRRPMAERTFEFEKDKA
jgi:hypothetical protein